YIRTSIIGQMTKPQRHASVRSASNGLPETAANLRARAELATKIKVLVRLNGWTQIQAARLCDQTQPRINDLLRGRVARFSLDALVNITAALERHSKPLDGSAMDYTEDEGQRLAAEFMAKLAARPVKAIYDLATLGAKTRQGGEVVTASTDMAMDGHRIACVGDVVRYSDGTESKIVSGAGFALTFKGRPMAIVGSATENGDTIINSLQSVAQIREYADDDGIPGLLQPGYLAPEAQA
ncbi:XRE family transcriptional regulator, partial [Ralstonia pseudosolanacearum]|uniref:XRE family transcriptional regulator n=2 Tax=Ralstonia TaxID=48736 RepID=UPI003AB00C22